MINLLTTTFSTVSSIDLKLEDEAFSVFPNPANEFITTTIDLPKISKNVRINIFNIQGQIMETRNLNDIQQNEQIQFDLSTYSSGTYMMSIDTDFGHSIQRFVIQK